MVVIYAVSTLRTTKIKKRGSLNKKKKVHKMYEKEAQWFEKTKSILSQKYNCRHL